MKLSTYILKASLVRYAPESLFKEIKDVTGLAEAEDEWIKEKCSGAVDKFFKKKGFGSNVAKTLIQMKIGYKTVRQSSLVKTLTSD